MHPPTFREEKYFNEEPWNEKASRKANQFTQGHSMCPKLSL